MELSIVYIREFFSLIGGKKENWLFFFKHPTNTTFWAKAP